MPSQRQTEVAVIEARFLSSQGRSQAAMQLLMSVGKNNLSPAGLDLLARLSLVCGQVVKSRALWNRALQIDPSFKAASDALEVLGSHWILKSVVKRMLQLTGIACAIVLMLLGMTSLFMSKRSTVPQRAAIRPRSSLNLPAIINCDVSAESKGVRIIFKNGLFRYRCVFTDQARDDLNGFAQTLGNADPDVQIIIEGHTESFPLPSNRDYADNLALCFARAEAVARVLSTEHGIPMSRIFLTSAGAASLFPENNGIQPKNRTVVIKLMTAENLGMQKQ